MLSMLADDIFCWSDRHFVLPFEVSPADLLASEITGRPDFLVSGI